MEQMEEADMWQMMETNISGGRLRMEGREVVGEVRDMIFCPRIFWTISGRSNSQEVYGECQFLPMIRCFEKKKMATRFSHLMFMKDI